MRPESRPVPGLLELLPGLESETWSDPSPRNVMGLADAYRLAGRFDEAMELLAPLLAEDAAAISPRVLFAWCLAQAGRDGEAAAALEAVRGLDPLNPWADVSEPARPATSARSAPEDRPLAGTEAEAEPERALTPAELARVPPSPLYSATLAEIFERQGFEEKAIEIYEEVVRAHPERADLRERIAALRARLPPRAS
jgi:tetratricopeptide (TPR) repeat protein